MKYLIFLAVDGALIRFGGLSAIECYIMLSLLVISAIGFGAEVSE